MAINLNKKTSDKIAGYLFILPTLIGVMTFSILPILFVVMLSFTDWTFTGSFHFIGITNFIDNFKDEHFIKAIFNTVYYTILSVPGTVIVALILALVINQIAIGRTFFRSVYFLPVITSSVAISMVWIWIYDERYGVINAVLKLINIQGPAWIMNEHLVLLSIALMSIWWSAGYNMVLYLAGLQGISKSYYEAAEIDGASPISVLINITLPLLTPTIFFTVITSIISSFQVFDQAMVMTGGGPDYASHTLVLHIYNTAFQFMKLGAASSVATLLFVVILGVTAIQLIFQKRWVFYEGD